MVNFHLVGDYRAIGVADRLYVRDGKALVAEIGERFLQGVMELIFERGGLRGRREDAGIDAIGFGSGFAFEQYHLSRRIGRKANLGLIMKPGARRDRKSTRLNSS